MLRVCSRHTNTLQHPCVRSFFSSTPQTFTVNRTLPHTQEELYHVISDIDTYSSFVPFCTSSVVTERKHGAPSKADLKVGFKTYEESFSSHVRCTPPKKVEAVANDHPLFQRLVTAWRLQEQTDKQCRVHLDIEYQFSNPMYGALSNAVLPKVADQIIAAFEKHANEILQK